MCQSSVPDAQEVWKDIPSSPGYQASTLGRIRSIPHVVECKNGQRQTHGGRIIGSPDGKGYLHVFIRDHDKRRWFAIHRLILEAFVGQCPPNHEACHNDNNPTNNRLDNLRWDTRSANHRDKRRHGTFRSNSLIGKRFSRLLVVSLAGFAHNKSLWSCLCDCGTLTTAPSNALVTGAKRSCGCLQRELASLSWMKRPDTRWIEYNGQRMCVADWGRYTGLGSAVIASRIDRLGWNIEDALTRPLRRRLCSGIVH